ncbi:hypothetical protein CRUP_023051 [Coryphaenoides rupestris]|nr:hypothetical protein CRUP_023051 [Coryphaenoides rupestris]
MRSSEELEELLVDNERARPENIAEELRSCLPPEAMLSSEGRALQKMQQQPKPAVHVDAFLYGEEEWTPCNVLPDLAGRTLLDVGSRLGAVLYGVKHHQHQHHHHHQQHHRTTNTPPPVPSTRTHLGYVYSAASRLVGVEISEEFVRLQTGVMEKYGFTDRMQVTSTAPSR